MNPTDPYTPSPRIPLKYILIGAGILFIVIILALLFFYRANNKQVVEKKNAFTESSFLPGIQSVYTSKSDPNQLTIFNGRNFIQYNLVSKQTSRLVASDMTWPKLSDIRWSKDGKSISFSAKSYSLDDDLGKILKASNKSLGVDHYWTFDIKNKKAKLIQNTNNDIHALYWSRQDDNIFYYTIQETDEEGGSAKTVVYKVDNSTNNSNTLFETTGIIRDLADLSPRNLIALIGDGTHYLVTPFTDNSRKNSIASLNTDTFKVSPDSNNFYSFEASESDDNEEGATDISGVLNISRVNDGKKIQAIKDENLSYVYQWAPDSKNIYSFYYKNNQAITRMYNLDKNVETVLKASASEKAPQLISITPTIKDWRFLFNTTSGIGLTTDEKIEKPYSAPLSSIATQNFAQGFVIGIQNDNTVRINIYNNPVDLYKQKALDYIKAKGITPDLINYSFDTTAAEEKQ